MFAEAGGNQNRVGIYRISVFKIRPESDLAGLSSPDLPEMAGCLII